MYSAARGRSFNNFFQVQDPWSYLERPKDPSKWTWTQATHNDPERVNSFHIRCNSNTREIYGGAENQDLLRFFGTHTSS